MLTKTLRLLSARGAAAGAVLALLGCATGRNDMNSPVVASPVNMPDHFMVVMGGLAQREEPQPGERCKSQLVDPRGKINATILTLRRSADGKGDYTVDTMGDESPGLSGKTYGLTSKQLLRIDCATGKALGIVDE